MKDEGLVILRDLAKQSGVEVGYDANTKNVSLGGKEYTEKQLSSLGGVKTDGRWSIPTSVAGQLFGTPVQTPTVQTPTVQAPIVNQAQQTINTAVPQTIQQRDPSVQQALQTQYQADIMELLDSNMASNIQSTNATLKSNLEGELANLELVFQNAINEGKMSVREAGEAFEQQKLSIEQQAYQDSERTNINAEQRGVQNSQQLAGMEASNNARANSLINMNIKDRDNRIANIKDKLTALSTEKGIRSGTLVNKFNSDQVKYMADMNSQRTNAIIDMKKNDYEFNRKTQHDIDMREDEQRFSNEQLISNQGFQNNQLDKTHSFQNSQLDKNISHDLNVLDKTNAQQDKFQEKGFENNIKILDKEQAFTEKQTKDAQAFTEKLSKTEFSRRLEEMAIKNGYDLNAMKQQHIYSSSQISQQSKARLAEISAGNENAKEMLELETEAFIKKSGFEMSEKYKYSLKENATEYINVIKEEQRQNKKLLDSLVPNTPEWKALKAQQKISMDNYVMESVGKLAGDLIVAQKVGFDPSTAFKETFSEQGGRKGVYDSAISSGKSHYEATKIANKESQKYSNDILFSWLTGSQTQDSKTKSDREAVARFLEENAGAGEAYLSNFKSIDAVIAEGKKIESKQKSTNSKTKEPVVNQKQIDQFIKNGGFKFNLTPEQIERFKVKK